VIDNDGTDIFDNARATIYCNDCDGHWDTDDGYHWYGEYDDELQKYQATDDEHFDTFALQIVQRMISNYLGDPRQLTLPIDLPARPALCGSQLEEVGCVFVDDNRKPHCPRCGGLLHVAPWPAG
jgi:hypothetical protein